MKYYSKKYIKQLKKKLLLKKKPKIPVLKILIGPPGSGKGTIMKKYKLNNKYTVMINYDEIINNNPMYIKEKKLINNSNELQKLYFKYRSEIYNIDNILHKEVIDNNYSILWETTGYNVDFMYNWFYEFKKKKYRIDLHLLCVDINKLNRFTFIMC